MYDWEGVTNMMAKSDRVMRNHVYRAKSTIMVLHMVGRALMALS